MEPGTIMLIANALSAGSDFMQNKSNQKEKDAMYDNIRDMGDTLKDSSDNMFSVANYFKPGGMAFKDAEKNAISNAFTTAGKGQEDLLAKGINLTSYGMGTAADIIKDDFTSTLMTDYKDLSNIGTKYAGLGANLLGKYTDLIGSSYTAQLGEDDAASPFGQIFASIGSNPGTAAEIAKLF
jgi:hypothetical protein|tara:strand:+ start:1871 stop:2413 length:543 start_codon:yes stop_codon:yes gene_type:complete